MSHPDKWIPITSSDWLTWWTHKSFMIYHCSEHAVLGRELVAGYSYARCPICSATWTSWFDPKDHGMKLWKLRLQSAREPTYRLVEVVEGKLRYTKLVEIK
jgi:hypothetical protein